MKVGVWLNEDIDTQVGGGFSYADRLIHLIDNHEFSTEIEIVFLTSKSLIKSYKKEVVCLQFDKQLKKENIKQKLNKFIFKNSYFLKRLYSQADRNLKRKRIYASYRKQLIINNIDIIYYLSQTQCVIEDFPFISTNWDIGHISMYAFPEVSNKKAFNLRHTWYNETLKKAISIFSESEAGKEELISYLNINPARIKVLPIFPGGVIHQKVSTEKQQDLLKSFNIEKEKFFFYPAQFWAHKNHYNLLLAFKSLILKEPHFKLVLTGSDKGNLDYIKNKIIQLKLEEHVIYLGFMDLQSIYTLYSNAVALVMPTFLGPTNMPLLEARTLGCPVLCSDFKGHREQLEDGALYFNPLEANTIFETMDEILKSDFRQKLIEVSKNINNASKFNENQVIKILERNLIDISKYRSCWNH
ncbi:glycosyltransferase family 4 protein [Xanthomarina spongicola]|uniref:Glycosyltransferase involved in cell wall biosynthesis n=1 Tax=Xanthomarina spongicola TaxID=570520 RepID=A0A316DKA2_9FLAO|nr:glycosyltransferase family 1 protein [Xanthomarina spongicola]PWK18634.1 glycosyltransferase involved in cell wall biosynthesis [Xanthomarina spongicola]